MSKMRSAYHNDKIDFKHASHFCHIQRNKKIRLSLQIRILIGIEI